MACYTYICIRREIVCIADHLVVTDTLNARLTFYSIIESFCLWAINVFSWSGIIVDDRNVISLLNSCLLTKSSCACCIHYKFTTACRQINELIYELRLTAEWVTFIVTSVSHIYQSSYHIHCVLTFNMCRQP
ncbi:hypothetical protein KFK09_016879 [Dendrobium nobile]|uniref:Uncharacterized protein n=1 Tax=Dendrobium nobile TaxID=94219 RepID=A0A8T3B0X8_DENNO|nr:hypothetical protein KFK09_016879 [Dendrobium nobile]